MPAKGSHRAHDRAQVARVGHTVERYQQRGLARVKGVFKQIFGVSVLVGRHLEQHALVHGVANGHAIHLLPHDLENRNLTTSRNADDLSHAIVHLRTRGNVQRGARHLRAQRFKHRVTAGHVFAVVRRVAGTLLWRTAVLCLGSFVTLTRRLRLTLGVIWPVFGLRGRAAALESLAPLATASDGLAAALLSYGSWPVCFTLTHFTFHLVPFA